MDVPGGACRGIRKRTRRPPDGRCRYRGMDGVQKVLPISAQMMWSVKWLPNSPL